VLADLEALGYACEPIVVGAIHAGAPHRRQRAWLIAHADSSGLSQWGQSQLLAQQPAAFGSDWRLTEPAICRADDGVPDRIHRLRALGNAVVPQIPELIGRAILSARVTL
jgi:DNA (cytosine-5)-methyltransferase 1